MRQPASPRTVLRRVLLAALIGIVGALAVWLFRWLLAELEILLVNSSTGLVEAARALSPWRRAVTPLLGAAAAGMLLWAYQRHEASRVRRHDIPSDYIEAINIGHGLIDVRTSLVKCAASLLVVATGSAIGREGAMILLAALAASLLGQRLAPRSEWRLMVACGAAAGMAAAYHAPLAGALFVAEVLIGTLAIAAITPVAIAAVCSLVVTQWLSGAEVLYRVPPLPVPQYYEYLLLIVFGLVCGVGGAAFLWALDGARRGFRSLKLPLPLQLALGGALVGLLSVLYPEVWGNGFSVVRTLQTAPPGALLIAALFAAKLAAMLASNGSGAPGGVFTPTLFAGAAFGALAAKAMTPWIGADHLPLLMALCGMATWLAATTHAPVMAALMVFEMTGEYMILPALLPACVLAATVSGRLHAVSVYGAADGRSPQKLTR